MQSNEYIHIHPIFHCGLAVIQMLEEDTVHPDNTFTFLSILIGVAQIIHFKVLA